MKSNLVIFIFSVLGCCVFAQEEAIKKVKITASELNARTGTTTRHHILGSFKRDEIVPVYEEKDGWYRTKCPDDTKVYIFQKYIKVNGNDGLIDGNDVNGRSAPSESSAVLFRFQHKTKVDVLGVAAGGAPWIQIAVPPSASSWISKDFTADVTMGNLAVVDDNKTNNLVESTGEGELEHDHNHNKGTIKELENEGLIDVNRGPSQEAIEIANERNRRHENIKSSTEENIKNIILEKDEDKFIYKGWVKRLGRVIGRKATHSLQVVHGEDVCHLISKNPEIKLEDYAGKMIGFRGDEIGREKRSKVTLYGVTEVVLFEDNPDTADFVKDKPSEEK